MASHQPCHARVFKAARFSRAAKKAHIDDAELCTAASLAMKGQADDLGGGVFKKRLGANRYRSLILAKGGECWVYEYLFAKQDRANIDDRDLADLRRLAKIYEALNETDIGRLLHNGAFTEICHDGET